MSRKNPGGKNPGLLAVVVSGFSRTVTSIVVSGLSADRDYFTILSASAAIRTFPSFSITSPVISTVWPM